ncbi:MAG: aldehyde dehydrogenase family protein [Thaumarchaeota archaeon]|nr:aldehyde dehydrogenase family protein [Nitrososphaerota archaeon]MCL5318073.1 aldehyde dehydrogenase family protein [Nitrososphaerota archaeon]
MAENMEKKGFENENTWTKALDAGEVERFHRRYDAAVTAVRKQFGRKYPNIIDGKEVYSSGGEFEDCSPNDTRIVLGKFQKGTREDAAEAVEAAAKAFRDWSQTDYRKRTAILQRAADFFSERKFELAAWMSFENGKNRFEAIGDVDEAIDLTRYYCHILNAEKGFDRPMGRVFPGETTRSILKPYGVWGVVSPFNFPLAIAAGMTMGVIVTGNTAVFKPASDTPLMGFKLYEALKDAGLPKGVFNYVTGPGGTVGEELVENQTVKGIVFTGSKDVGFKAYKKFSEKVPRTFIAELGGKNPVIVTAKADIDKAVEGVFKASFGYSGQKCSAASRVYVEKSVKKQFTEKLVAKTKELTVGNSVEKGTFVGPVINEKAYKNFRSYCETAFKDGKVLTGGHAITEGDKKYGYYVEPTVIDRLAKDHRLFKEELFVPIVCIAEIKNLDEGLQLANDVEYGLTAGIFTQDQAEAKKFLDEIEAGVVYVNRKVGATTGAMAGAQPFVGWKMSGTSGRGAGGPYYLQQFLREQSQTVYP